MNTKIVKLDINRNLYDTLTAKQGDTQSRFLLFQLLDGAIPFSLENRSVKVFATKPDGKEVFNDLIINDRVKGYCTLELTNQMLAVPGLLKLELMVIEGDKKLTTNVFYMDVKKSINSENAIVSTNEFSALLNGLASLNEYDNYKNEIAAARDGEVNLLTKVKKIDEHLDNIENKVISISVKDFGAKGDGVTDDTLAFQNVVKEIEKHIGGTIFIPNGKYIINDTILINGCNPIDDLPKGGIQFKGESQRGAQIKCNKGISVFQLGNTNSKSDILFEEMSIFGADTVQDWSIAIDSRTVGGSYVFNNVKIHGFDIGIRYHDNTLITATHLQVRHCNLGIAMGYYSDVQSYIGCRFDYNKKGFYLGYNPSSTTTPTESHVVDFIGCIFNLNDICGIIEGSGTEAVKFDSCYMEQYGEIALILGDRTLAKATLSNIIIDNCFFNGNRQINGNLGKKNHAIEINRAFCVDIRGCGFRNHLDSPINIRHIDARVKVDLGKFDIISGEKGDVKLPNGTYKNVNKGNTISKPLMIGRISSPVNFVTSPTLPSANEDWAFATLNLEGIEYKCSQNKDGTWAWQTIPNARDYQYLIPKTKSIGINNFSVVQGSPSLETIDNKYICYSFPDGVMSGISSFIEIPKEWDTFHIQTLMINNTTTTTGTVSWHLDYQFITDGTVIGTPTTKSAGLPAPSQNKIKRNNTFANITNNKNSEGLLIKIRRDGAGDSYSDKIGLVGIVAYRVS